VPQRLGISITRCQSALFTAACILNADAGGECNVGINAFALMPVDEVMDVVEADEADKDEIDGDNVVEQPRHDQDQDAGNDGDKRRDMGSGDDHDFVL
jgi:hypothetical protein